MMSVHDPEMRHVHKSSSRRFDGHKAAIVVDTDSQMITAVEVLPGNAPDNLGALELVEQSEANTGVPVEEAMGDAAYSDGDTRQAFADAGRTLTARAPGRPDRKHFPKEDFHIDLEAGSCTCPAGQVTRTIVPAGRRTDQMGRTYRLKAFRFDAAVCGMCPLRTQCVAEAPGTGRTVQLYPQSLPPTLIGGGFIAAGPGPAAERGHPMRVQIVENQPDHRDIRVGLIHQPPHLLSEVLHGALPGYRHVAPAPARLTGEEQVACPCPLVFVVLTPRPPRLCRQRFRDVGQQLG